MLIQFAYDILSAEMAGGSDWLGSERFNIEANLSSGLAAVAGEERTRQIRLMTQSLLADRFRLRIHLETRRQPVYELVVAKGGSKLKAADPMKPGPIGVRDGQIFRNSARLDVLSKMLTGELGRRLSTKPD
jgi:uncharacterized protein (TIGR03435 family)